MLEKTDRHAVTMRPVAFFPPLVVAAGLFLLYASDEYAALQVSDGTFPVPRLPPPHAGLFPTVNVAPARGWMPGATLLVADDVGGTVWQVPASRVAVPGGAVWQVAGGASAAREKASGSFLKKRTKKFLFLGYTLRGSPRQPG